MDDLFDFPVLRVRQPGRLLPNRASYEIFNSQRQRLAIASETEAHTVRQLLSKVMPDDRALTVTADGGEPILVLAKHAKDRVTEVRRPGGELFGRIRATGTTRHYMLTGEKNQTVAKVAGDLALKRFDVTGAGGSTIGRVTKTWAGLAKEMLTPSDHYKVEFIGPVHEPARTLTVMTAIVLDLTLYGPV